MNEEEPKTELQAFPLQQRGEEQPLFESVDGSEERQPEWLVNFIREAAITQLKEGEK